MAQIDSSKTHTTCTWCLSDPLYIRYHDTEWGVPLYDETKMFEFMVLESFQAGLSWWTVLQKRENFREAFDQFDAQKIARYDDLKIDLLTQDAGIIRHRGKIEATRNNAQKYLEMREQGSSLVEFFWDYVDGSSIDTQRTALSQIPSSTELSDRIARDLKQRGFRFLGSTTVYAHLQAAGLVNDHLVSCPQHAKILTA